MPLSTDLFFSFWKMLEIGADMEMKAKSNELVENTEAELPDISFEELLAQEKKDAFWSVLPSLHPLLLPPLHRFGLLTRYYFELQAEEWENESVLRMRIYFLALVGENITNGSMYILMPKSLPTTGIFLLGACASWVDFGPNNSHLTFCLLS